MSEMSGSTHNAKCGNSGLTLLIVSRVEAATYAGSMGLGSSHE
eukprot:CAMPEP_0172851970 /NCGR_PEP_ID=MMETSP1075-20121228/51957_1 /TAXON_ID=2916 /ORGANISM="Ceratium fusus, Strain PA161109" /LENGTH=42 /DNA_ID= /DNA_START= /DNA_END= /DNA_ORIENTATION=